MGEVGSVLLVRKYLLILYVATQAILLTRTLKPYISVPGSAISLEVRLTLSMFSLYSRKIHSLVGES